MDSPHDFKLIDNYQESKSSVMNLATSEHSQSVSQVKWPYSPTNRKSRNHSLLFDKSSLEPGHNENNYSVVRDSSVSGHSISSIQSASSPNLIPKSPNSPVELKEHYESSQNKEFDRTQTFLNSTVKEKSDPSFKGRNESLKSTSRQITLADIEALHNEFNTSKFRTEHSYISKLSLSESKDNKNEKSMKFHRGEKYVDRLKKYHWESTLDIGKKKLTSKPRLLTRSKTDWDENDKREYREIKYHELADYLSRYLDYEDDDLSSDEKEKLKRKKLNKLPSDYDKDNDDKDHDEVRGDVFISDPVIEARALDTEVSMTQSHAPREIFYDDLGILRQIYIPLRDLQNELRPVLINLFRQRANDARDFDREVNRLKEISRCPAVTVIQPRETDTSIAKGLQDREGGDNDDEIAYRGRRSPSGYFDTDFDEFDEDGGRSRGSSLSDGLSSISEGSNLRNLGPFDGDYLLEDDENNDIYDNISIWSFSTDSLQFSHSLLMNNYLKKLNRLRYLFPNIHEFGYRDVLLLYDAFLEIESSLDLPKEFRVEDTMDSCLCLPSLTDLQFPNADSPRRHCGSGRTKSIFSDDGNRDVLRRGYEHSSIMDDDYGCESHSDDTTTSTMTPDSLIYPRTHFFERILLWSFTGNSSFSFSGDLGTLTLDSTRSMKGHRRRIKRQESDSAQVSGEGGKPHVRLRSRPHIEGSSERQDVDAASKVFEADNDGTPNVKRLASFYESISTASSRTLTSFDPIGIYSSGRFSGSQIDLRTDSLTNEMDDEMRDDVRDEFLQTNRKLFSNNWNEFGNPEGLVVEIEVDEDVGGNEEECIIIENVMIERENDGDTVEDDSLSMLVPVGEHSNSKFKEIESLGGEGKRSAVERDQGSEKQSESSSQNRNEEATMVPAMSDSIVEGKDNLHHQQGEEVVQSNNVDENEILDTELKLQSMKKDGQKPNPIQPSEHGESPSMTGVNVQKNIEYAESIDPFLSSQHSSEDSDSESTPTKKKMKQQINNDRDQPIRFHEIENHIQSNFNKAIDFDFSSGLLHPFLRKNSSLGILSDSSESFKMNPSKLSDSSCKKNGTTTQNEFDSGKVSNESNDSFQIRNNPSFGENLNMLSISAIDIVASPENHISNSANSFNSHEQYKNTAYKGVSPSFDDSPYNHNRLHTQITDDPNFFDVKRIPNSFYIGRDFDVRYSIPTKHAALKRIQSSPSVLSNSLRRDLDINFLRNGALECDNDGVIWDFTLYSNRSLTSERFPFVNEEKYDNTTVRLGEGRLEGILKSAKSKMKTAWTCLSSSEVCVKDVFGAISVDVNLGKFYPNRDGKYFRIKNKYYQFVRRKKRSKSL